MDYSEGVSLWHFQWDEIQDPNKVWVKWSKGESEGENVESFFNYPVIVSKFLWKFRYAYVNHINFVYKIIDEFSTDEITLSDGKKYEKVAFEVTSEVNLRLTKQNAVNAGVIFDEFKYDFGNFYITTDNNPNNFENYIFPDKEIYNLQLSNLIRQIKVSKDKELITLLSILPENKFAKFDIRSRIDLLKKLSFQTLNEESGGANGEKVVINLFKFAPDNQKCDLLSFLKDERIGYGSPYYDVFYNEIDNSILGIGENNSDEYISIVKSFEQKCFDRLTILANTVKENYSTLNQNLSETKQNEVLSIIEKETDWLKLSAKLDANKIIPNYKTEKRYLYTYLREGLTGPKRRKFINTIYNKSKTIHPNNRLSLEKCEEYLMYYANMKKDYDAEVRETEENIILDIIDTSPKQYELFSYMSKNKLFVPLAKAVDDVGGNQNYTAFYKLLLEIYKNNNSGDVRKTEILFHKNTQFAFVNFITREIGLAPVGHIEVSASAMAGNGSLNANVSNAFGIGWDGLGNVAMYGNFNICANSDFKNLLRYDDFCKSTNESNGVQMDKFTNFIVGASAGISISLNIDWWAKDLRTLFGIGTTVEGGLGNVSFLINRDDKKDLIGFGLGYSNGVGLPISISKTSAINFGLIVSGEEFKELIKIFMFEADLCKKALEYKLPNPNLNEGYLIFYGKETSIKIRKDDNFLISLNLHKYYE